MSLKIDPQFYLLLNDFKKKLLFGDTPKFGIQSWFKDKKALGQDPGYLDQKRQIKNIDFENHFYNYHPFEDRVKFLGSLGICPASPDLSKLKFIVFDCDDEKRTTKAIEELLPLFDSYGIEYIIGWGDSKERCHIWVFLDACSAIKTKIFIKQCLKEINADTSADWFEEIFGVTKLKNIVRLDGGYHLKRGVVHPVEYKKRIQKTPVDVVKAFIDCKVITDADLDSWIKEVPLEDLKAQAKPKRSRKFVKYFKPINLPLPMEDLPPVLKKCARQCQAINKAISDVVEEEGLETPGGMTHDRGLALTGLARYNDFKLNTEDGKAWIEFLEENYRFRPAESHQWDHTPINDETENMFSWSCDTWEEKFDNCKGCPFRGSIQNPKWFFWGKPYKAHVKEEVVLFTPEWIWANIFPEFKKDVKDFVANGERKNLLLATFMGSRKSITLNDLAVELAQDGKKVLLAVPTAKLALEQLERFKIKGVKAFVLASHRNIFGKQGAEPKDFQLSDFDCPSFEEIQALNKLGVSSGSYKDTYCTGCPLVQKCYYPNQYTQVMDPKYQIVIIQHSHIQCQEVVFELMRKGFDALFIDESFIEGSYVSMPVEPKDIEILESQNYNWIPRLVDWLRGESKSIGKIDPLGVELTALQGIFSLMERPWIVPDYIRFYNQARRVHPVTGIEVIYELPNIPVKVFTDATPPVELLEKIIGEKIDKIYGGGLPLDLLSIHPDNKIIQVLDGSCSQFALKKDDRLEKILGDIAYIMEFVYPDKKALITCYKGHKKAVEDFFLDNNNHYPTLFGRLVDDPLDNTIKNRITVYRMDKGINDYWDYDIQFILSAVYGTEKLYRTQKYKFMEVENYYRNKHGLEENLNLFPFEVKISDKVRYIDQGLPITRIEKIFDKYFKVWYSDFKHFPPEDSYMHLIYKYNNGNAKQNIRLRFTPTKGRTVLIYHNLPLEDLLITKSIQESEILPYFESL